MHYFDVNLFGILVCTDLKIVFQVRQTAGARANRQFVCRDVTPALDEQVPV
jgi:hypothetical protein